MARPYQRYAKEIQEALHYGGTWTPGTPLRLGQLGTFEDGIFVPQGHLNSLGISFRTEIDDKPTAYTYASADGVTLRFKARGESAQAFKSLADAQAGVAFSFHRSHALVFSAGQCLEHRIADVFGLQTELANLLNRGSWKEDWAVITHLVVAGSATIVLSASADTVLELEASGSVAPGPAKLGDLSAGVALSYSDSMNQMIVASAGLTPLFHSLRLRRSFWTGKPQPVLNKSRSAPVDRLAISQDSFELVDYDDGGPGAQ